MSWRVAACRVEEFQAWMERYFPVTPESEVRFLQASPGRFVAAAGGWVIKESGPRPGRSRLAFAFRASTARLIVERANALLACGIPTHEPVAWAVRRAGGLRLRDYMITREITEAEPLTFRLDRHRDEPQARTGILRVLGALAASLHRQGFGNRDLRDANILCSFDAPPRMWITDLEGVRKLPHLPAGWAGGDLKPVAHSLRSHGWLRDDSDEAAFFEAYNAGVPGRLRRAGFPL